MERTQTLSFEFPDPALVDVLQRHWIEVVKLFPSAPDRDDKVGGFEYAEVLSDRLPRHVEVLA